MRPIAALTALLALAASPPAAAQGIAVAVPAGCAALCAPVPLPVDSVDVSAKVEPVRSRTIVEHTIRNPAGETVDGQLFVAVPADAEVGIVSVREGPALLRYGYAAELGLPVAGAEEVLREHPHLPLRPLPAWRVIQVPLPGMEPGATYRVQVSYTEPPRHDGARRTYTVPLSAAAGAPFAHVTMTVEVRTEHGFRGEVASPTHAVRVRGGSEMGRCHPNARCGTTTRPSRRVRVVRFAAGAEAAAANFRIEYLPLDADDPDAVDGPEPWPDTHRHR